MHPGAKSKASESAQAGESNGTRHEKPRRGGIGRKAAETVPYTLSAIR